MTTLMSSLEKLSEPLERSAQPRLLGLRAELLPPEITAADNSRRSRALVAVGILVLVVMLGAWDVSIRLASRSAESRLASVQDESAQLRRQQRAFTELLQTQNATQALSGLLASVMAGDVDWYRFLPALRKLAPAGVSVATVHGQIAAGNGPAAASTQTTTTGNNGQSSTGAVGTLTIGGSALSNLAIASYVERLAAVTGLRDPFLSDVHYAAKTFSFSVQLTITSDAYSTRFQSSRKTR